MLSVFNEVTGWVLPVAEPMPIEDESVVSKLQNPGLAPGTYILTSWRRGEQFSTLPKFYTPKIGKFLAQVYGWEVVTFPWGRMDLLHDKMGQRVRLVVFKEGF